jgi:DNA-binding PadR family transcriptional regulator
MAVREGILALLLGGPKHGYQLRAEYDASLGAPKPLNLGQVYSTLERLTRNGLVAVAPSPAGEDGAGDEPVDGRRKHYELTEQGRAEAEAWFSSPVPLENLAGRDELSTKIVLAIGAGGVDEVAVIGSERTALVQRLQVIRREMRAAGDLARQVATDAAAARLEADLAWLDRCEERVRAATTGRTTTRGRKA